MVKRDVGFFVVFESGAQIAVKMASYATIVGVSATILNVIPIFSILDSPYLRMTPEKVLVLASYTTFWIGFTIAVATDISTLVFGVRHQEQADTDVIPAVHAAA